MSVSPSPNPADRGPTMNSSNGKRMYPFDPRADEIDIEVVAHHLACNCRWNGATQHKFYPDRIFFSVAEHSVLVARFIREELKMPHLELEALLHDAPEYLLSDMIRPIKYHPEIYPIYTRHELNAERVIAEKFGLQFPMPSPVKIADDAVCAAEFQQIVPHDPNDARKPFHDGSVIAPYQIQMMMPSSAKRYFLSYYEDALARRKALQDTKR